MEYNKGYKHPRHKAEVGLTMSVNGGRAVQINTWLVSTDGRNKKKIEDSVYLCT
jgi:hypothetical protein